MNLAANEQTADSAALSEAKRVIRVMMGRKVVIVGAVILAMFILTAIFAPLLAPYGPYDIAPAIALQQASHAHLLGTDQLGRDELSRIIYGTQISIMVGLVAVAIAFAIGTAMGLAAGYLGYWTNTIIMRITDTLMCIPPLVLALAVASALGGGLRNIMISIGISLVPTYTRLMVGQTLTIKENDYITAAHAMGQSSVNIMTQHILPNAFAPLLILISLNMGTAILSEASLSFLGVGIAPPGAAWGSMVSQGYRFMLTNPLLSLAPGVGIVLVVLSFNMVGDGLRDALDPRLRGKL